MYRRLIPGIFSALIALSCSFTQADVLDFDSITAPNNFDNTLVIDGFTLPAGFAGVFDATVVNGAIFPAAHSGPNAMLNWNSRVGEIFRDEAFNFEGAFFHPDNRDGDAMVDFAGYDGGGNLLYSESRLISGTWTYHEFNWDGITRFTWDPVSPDISNIGIDDFTYNVPEPSSIALIAMVGLISLRRRARGYYVN